MRFRSGEVLTLWCLMSDDELLQKEMQWGMWIMCSCDSGESVSRVFRPITYCVRDEVMKGERVMLDHLLLKHFRFRCDWDMSQIVGMSTAVFTTDEHRYFGVIMISQMMFRRRKRC
jgi:hypothetical protein